MNKKAVRKHIENLVPALLAVAAEQVKAVNHQLPFLLDSHLRLSGGQMGGNDSIGLIWLFPTASEFIGYKNQIRKNHHQPDLNSS